MGFLPAVLLSVAGLFIPVGPEVPVSSNATVAQSGYPAVAVSDSGHVVTVWTTEPALSANTAQYRLIQPDGAVGVQGVAMWFTTIDQIYHHAAVAMASDGRFVVVAELENVASGDRDIVGRTFEASGTPERLPFTVNAAAPIRNQRRPEVAAFANGDFYVVWVEEFSPTDDDIYHAIWFNSTTNSFSECLAPQSFMAMSQMEGFPRVAVDPGAVQVGADESSIVVAYSRPNANIGLTEFVAQRVNTAGTKVGQPVPFSASDPSDDMAFGDVAMDDAAGFVTAWMEGGLIFRRRFNSAGLAQNVNDLMAGPGFGAFHSNTRVAADKSGDYLVGFDFDTNSYATEYNADDTVRRQLLIPESVRGLPLTSSASDVSRNGQYAAVSWVALVNTEALVMTRRFRRVETTTDSDGDGVTDSLEAMGGSDPNDPNSLPQVLDLNVDGKVNSADAIHWYRHLTGGPPRAVPGSE